MSERLEGIPIVLTAPLTESIDHAGFFIQMSLASIPGWMEWAIDRKYPAWRNVPTSADGSAGTAPAGLRVLETVLARTSDVYADSLASPALCTRGTRLAPSRGISAQFCSSYSQGSL